MLPLVAAAAIGAGTSLFGGLLGQRGASKSRDQEIALQREFAQHGVRWRVEDAKAAGVHPLYALGASGLPSYSPSFNQSGNELGQGIAEAGQHVARAVGAQQTQYERNRSDMELALLGKQLEETDARINLLNSEAMRNFQSSFQSAPIPGAATTSIGELEAPDVMRGQVEVVPNEVGTMSLGDDSVGAGTNFLWRRFNLGPDFPILLPGGPSGSPEESLEAVTESIPAMVAVIAENMRRNPQFTEQAVSHYLGPEAGQIYRWLRSSSPFPSPGRAMDAARGVAQGFKRWSDRFRQLNK